MTSVTKAQPAPAKLSISDQDPRSPPARREAGLSSHGLMFVVAAFPMLQALFLSLFDFWLDGFQEVRVHQLYQYLRTALTSPTLLEAHGRSTCW